MRPVRATPRIGYTPAAVATTQRYKLTIAYRGTRYHGWQAQPLLDNFAGDRPPEGQGMRTVQETLERTLAGVLRHPVTLSGSSRTDKGVHAKGQIAHFDTDKVQIPREGLRRAINHRLPEDILIRKLEPVPDTFHALYCPERKRYQYTIWNHPNRPVFFFDLAWHRWFALNSAKMAEAAKHFVGIHDFASFCRPGHGKPHTIRTIYGCSVAQRGPRIVVGVEGRGFLWNQVRIMVGTLVHVGLGKYPPDVIVEMLAAKDRTAGGPTAPAHGLYLQWIKMKPGVECMTQQSADAAADAAPSGLKFPEALALGSEFDDDDA